MYGVKTGRLNEQVKRNIERFPEDFMFQLTKGELEILKSQNATSKAVERRGGTQKPPYAFTENGVAMLSSVLRSPLAIQVNIGIMRALAELQAEHRQQPKRKPIGFIQPEDDNDEEQSSGLQ